MLMTMVLLTGECAMAATPITLSKGSKVGVYVAYDGLKSSGNYIDNVCLIFDGSQWNSENVLQWKDSYTSAAFLAYYPYVEDVKDARAVPFTVKKDQSIKEAYVASDFLYGNSWSHPVGGFPKPVLHHGMTNIVVNVKAGDGFSEDELKQGNLSVHVNNVYMQANVNLENGEVRTSGSIGSIKAYATSALSLLLYRSSEILSRVLPSADSHTDTAGSLL